MGNCESIRFLLPKSPVIGAATLVVAPESHAMLESCLAVSDSFASFIDHGEI